MSLGSVILSHERCVTYSESNLTMALHSSLKRVPARCRDLSNLLGTGQSQRLKIRERSEYKDPLLKCLMTLKTYHRADSALSVWTWFAVS